jgi:hypothetical protein
MSVLNKDHNCSAIHYGNPSEYLEKLKKYYGTKDLPTRYFDLMPNYDMGSYWTGYYTTYPELKKLCKDSSRLLNLYKKALLHAVSTRKNIVVESLVKKDRRRRETIGYNATSRWYHGNFEASRDR